MRGGLGGGRAGVRVRMREGVRARVMIDRVT